jgi:transposase
VSKDEIIEQKELINQQQAARIASLEYRLKQLEKMIFGSKSERTKGVSIDPNQLSLFGDYAQSIDQQATQNETITYTRSKKKHPGRHTLPEHLPVEEVIIEPQDDVSGLKKIGEEITETLKYTPASLVKLRTIRPKYVEKEQDGVLIADLPSRPIDKSIAEACLLAFILVNKYVDHLPLYRQIQRFNRDFKWNPSQSTVGGWVQACCVLLEPLYNKLKQKLLSAHYLQADESPIKVLDKDKKGSSHQGYQWVYHDPLEKLVLFNYRKGRGMSGPKEILADYKGYLQCDGYSVYDKIGLKQGIELVGCLVHARRKFFDARDNDEQRANWALDKFKAIYKAEAQIKETTQGNLEEKQELRQKLIKPILEEIKDWIEQEGIKVLPKSAIGKAMTYYLNQYHKLINVVASPEIELDNNLIENKIRPLALGRKNYLFAGSHKAAQNTAIIYSFFASCKANDVNPRSWMQYVLENIKEYNIQNLEELLPNSDKFKV